MLDHSHFTRDFVEHFWVPNATKSKEYQPLDHLTVNQHTWVQSSIVSLELLPCNREFIALWVCSDAFTIKMSTTCFEELQRITVRDAEIRNSVIYRCSSELKLIWFLQPLSCMMNSTSWAKVSLCLNHKGSQNDKITSSIYGIINMSKNYL